MLIIILLGAICAFIGIIGMILDNRDIPANGKQRLNKWDKSYDYNNNLNEMN